MNVDLSTDQMKTISAAPALAVERCREKLGITEVQQFRLHALSEDEMKEFIRSCRRLEKDLDEIWIPYSEAISLPVEPIPPYAEEDL